MLLPERGSSDGCAVGARKCRLKRAVLLVSYITLACNFLGSALFTSLESAPQPHAARLSPAATAGRLPTNSCKHKDTEDASTNQTADAAAATKQASHVLHPELLLVAAQAPRFNTGAGRQQGHPKKEYQAHERRPSTCI